MQVMGNFQVHFSHVNNRCICFHLPFTPPVPKPDTLD